MEHLAGLQSGLNQANNQAFMDLSQLQATATVNSSRMKDFLDEKQAVKDDLTKTEDSAYQKLGEYGVAVGEKYTEYKDFVKEGGKLQDLGTYKFAKGVAGAVGDPGGTADAIRLGVKTTAEDVATQVKNKASQIASETSVSDAMAGARRIGLAGPSAQRRQKFKDYAESQEAESTEPAESIPETAESSAESTAEQIESTAEEVGEETASIGSKIAKNVAKVGGALFSAGQLGTDVYDQVKDHQFFYGVNTGDKVGNFMNELGSGADLLGVATGDPLLVLAGVGVGAVGSIVSDVSELFSGEKKEKAQDEKPPPVQISAPASSNLAGSGQIAETLGSTATQ